jgi:ribosomal protein S18 acetylase RimI-like enzyme
VSVRRATRADLATLAALWRAFADEAPAPPHVDVDEAHELAEIEELVEGGTGFLAEEGGEAVGFALGRRLTPRLGRLTDVYVVPGWRRRGLAAALVGAVAEALQADGAAFLELEAGADNAGARGIYKRWGFRDHLVTMVAPLDHVRERLAPGRHAESFASIHVQTDDRGAVERAVAQYAPRVGSKGSRVEGPRNGWTAVYDEAVDDDPTVLLRFARELSSRMGLIVVALSLEVDQVVRMVALDRGGIVDEYLSVPEFYGPLAPGDVIGLAANPTVLARLTGADPDAVRRVAQTAASPAELPEPRSLLAALADVLGLEGADRGYGDPSG